jgi:hypothetical protein
MSHRETHVFIFPIVTLVPCAISSPPTKSSNEGPESSFRANVARVAVPLAVVVAVAVAEVARVRICARASGVSVRVFIVGVSVCLQYPFPPSSTCCKPEKSQDSLNDGNAEAKVDHKSGRTTDDEDFQFNDLQLGAWRE